MDFKKWLESLPGAPAPSTAADKAGLQRSTVLRQLRSEEGLAMDVVRDIARAVGANPVVELVNTGHLEEHEVPEAKVQQALKHATERELANELVSRTDPVTRRWKNPELADMPATAPIPANVVEFPENIVYEMPERAVADSSPDEPEDPDLYIP